MADAPCWTPPIPSTESCWDGTSATCNEEPPPPIPCPECPPVQPTGVWPNTYKTWVIQPNIQNTKFGSMNPNQKDLIWRLKNSYIASGQWSVVQSSTALVLGSGNADLWISGSAINRPAGSIGPYSWILLQRRDGVQLVIQISIDVGSCEFRIYASPTGIYTGGTVGSKPTATDEIIIEDLTYGGGSDWLGNEGAPSIDQLYTMHTWNSDDGTCTYTVIQSSMPGTLRTNTIICLFRPMFPSPGWTTPVCTLMMFGGPGQNSSTTPVPDLDAMMGTQAPVIANGNGMLGQIAMHAVLSGTNDNHPARVISEWGHADEQSAKFLLIRTGLFCVSPAGARSAGMGIIPDMMWAEDDGGSFHDGGTYNNGAGAAVIYFQRMVLPWVPGVVPLGWPAPTTVGPFYATGV